MEILEKALAMLEKHSLCDHCLGRNFAMLGSDMGNEERGRMIKTLLTLEAHQLALAKDKKGVAILKILASKGSSSMAIEVLKKLKRRPRRAENCFLCEGHFDSISEIVNRSVDMLKEYEYETFLVGVKLPTQVEEREDEFKADFQVQQGENIRNEFSREIGKAIFKATDRPVDYMRPQLVLLINPFTGEIEFQPNPLFIMGRYRKLKRGIPQTKWLCTRCRGRGCSECDWTGKLYPTSVEELISNAVLKATLGEDATLHAAGREDADARMLGRGRPFVLEVKRPKKRSVNLSALEQETNTESQGKMKISGLHFVDREAVERLKQIESREKSYRVVVAFEREVSDQELEMLEKSLTDVVVHQETPLRVLRRRSDLTREKYIYKTKVRRLTQNTIEMRIRCQGGLYVKELVTGDEGRTQPNVSSLLESKATPLELDVLGISMKSKEA